MTKPAGDEPKVGAGKGRPFICPECRKRQGQYMGRLVFENESPADATCPNHKTPIQLIAV